MTVSDERWTIVKDVDYTILFGGTGPQELTITTSGPVFVEGFARLIDDVLADARYRRGMAVLVDHAEADFSAVRPDEMQAVAQMLVDLDDRVGASRLAVVASSPASFGLVRVFQAYVDAAQVDVSLFYTRAEAEDWLRKG